jgi:hypothetical protein
MKKIASLILFLILVAVVVPLKADIYIEQENKGSKTSASEAGQDTLIKMWISDKAIRVEEPGGKMANIVDLENRQLITLDLTNKEYFVIPLDDVHSSFVKASTNLKRRMNMKWRVETLEGVEKVAGYDCVKVRFTGLGEITANNKKSQMKVVLDYWLASGTPVPDDLAAKLLEVMGMNNNPLIDQAIYKELAALKGYPLKFVTTMERGHSTDVIEQKVTKIEDVTVADGFYSIPMGFQEVSSPVTR